MRMEQQVRDYILENYLFTDDPAALDSTASFLETETLDSTGFMEVIFFLEDTFGIEVEEDEMTPENLDSVDNIVGFVTRKRQNVTASQ